MSESHALGGHLGARVLAGDIGAVDEAIDQLTHARLSPSFWQGFSGLAWLIHRSDALDPDALDPIDAALVDLLGHEKWAGHYDLINGLVGIGVYALAREHDSMLQRVVHHLIAMSRTDECGRFWWTDAQLLPEGQREDSPSGHVDLGVAHGMAGAAWLLAASTQRETTSGVARAALPEVVEWLRSRPRASAYGHFPAITRLDGPDHPAARLAWCYGDLGMGVVIAQCAKALGNEEWMAWSQDLALEAARRPDELSGVVDSSICHGSAGNALLFRRLDDLAPHPELQAAAARWKLAAAHSEPSPDPGLLEGQGGVELVLSGVDTTWDIALLARLP